MALHSVGAADRSDGFAVVADIVVAQRLATDYRTITRSVNDSGYNLAIRQKMRLYLRNRET